MNLETSTFLPPNNRLFALYGSQNKQLLLSCSTIDRICNRDGACLQRSRSGICIYNFDFLQPVVLEVKLNQLVYPSNIIAAAM